VTETSPKAGWELQEGRDLSRVRLYGHWNLLTRAPERARLIAELKAIGAPGSVVWDLRDIESMDSAGAAALWSLWGQRVPEGLRSRPDQRKWFERLAEVPTTPPRPRRGLGIPALLDRLGAELLAVLRDLGGIALLVGRLILASFYVLAHPRLIPWREISANVYKTGASAVPLIGVVGFVIGVVMTYQIALSISRFGANEMIVGLLGLAMLRELGPVVTAIILAGRSGSAITAGIGAMRITEEIDALKIFGSDPTVRIVLPGVIGMGLSVGLLVVWMDFVGMLGGIITSQAQLGVRHELFIERLPDAVPWINFWIGLGKGVFYGMLIATTASYFGLRVLPSTASLSEHTTRSVVTGLTLILLLDASSGVVLANVGLTP
jgi:phospholipid/cholesterol/gamma-HCH transport system permease protein